MFLYVILSTLALAAYIYARNTATYWKRKNVPHVPLNVMENIKAGFKSSTSFQQATINIYEKLKGYPYGGVYDGFKTKLFVLDPDLVKNIFVRDFDYFTDRSWDRFQVTDYLQNILLWIKGAHWKKIRMILTPAFTSGKLKAMEPLFGDCAQQAVENLQSRNDKSQEVELKMFFSQYTLDVIASCAFGIQINSMKQADSELVKLLHQFQYMPVWERVKIIASFTVIPNFLRKFITLWFINKPTSYVMKKVIMESVEYRRKNNTRRNDFLQLMIDIATDERKSGAKNLIMDDDTIIANSILFMLAGFETTSTVLSFTAYELALHPAIQDKLRDEINAVIKRHGALDYDALHELEYLEMILNESMRLHPSIARTNRVCVKPYKIPGSDFTIERGQQVTCPVVGFHYDDKYFPSPETFDPERFRTDVPTYTFMPFGVGPRNCIGKRFGLMSAKIILATLLTKYKLVRTDRTEVPCILDEEGVFLKPKNGIFVRFVALE